MLRVTNGLVLFKKCSTTFTFQSHGGLLQELGRVQREAGGIRPVVVGHPQEVLVVEAVVKRPGQHAGAKQISVNTARN